MRKLTGIVQADLESLKVTDGEVARQGRRLTPGSRWPGTAGQPQG